MTSGRFPYSLARYETSTTCGRGYVDHVLNRANGAAEVF